MKSSYIKINELFHHPETIIEKWGLGEGVGIWANLAEGKGDVTLEFDGSLYTLPKKDLRKAKRNGWTYLAKGQYELIVTPFASWKRLGTKIELEEKRREALLRYAVQ